MLMKQAFVFLFRPYRRFLAGVLVLLTLSAVLESTGIGLFVPLMLILTRESGSLGAGADVLSSFLQFLSKYPREQQIEFIVALLLGSIVLKNVLGYAGRFLGHRLELRIVRDLRIQIFRKYLFSPYHFFLDRKHGHVVSDLFGESATAGQAVVTYLGLLANIITAIMLYGLLCFISWQVTATATGVFLVLTAGFQRLSRTSARFGILNQQRFRELTCFGTEAVLGIRQVKVFSAEQRIFKRFGELANEISRAKIWLRGISLLVQPVGEIVAALLLSLFVVIIVRTNFTTGLVISFIVTFIVVLVRLLPIVGSINRDIIILRAEITSVMTIMQLLSSSPMPVDRGPTRKFGEFRRDISFEDVTFAYPGTQGHVLRGVKIRCPKGAKTAIVGPSGAGKSTIVDLMIRLYEPTEGCIRVDGINIQDYDVVSWRNAIGFVSQDTFIFDASIRENIVFGWPEAKEADIVWAAKQADAHEFIQELRDGYDTEVGDRGLKLSGGQRQRLAIARAILRKPQILIFDEAASALDHESEQRVQQAIDRISKDRTVIIIAHRLSTIVRADNIIVLHGGQVVEEGTHEALIERRGVYSNLYKTSIVTENETVDNGIPMMNLPIEEIETSSEDSLTEPSEDRL